MAAATTAKTRPGHGLHLGSFSRIDIADFEGASQSRYPSIPSPSARPVSLADPLAMGQPVPPRLYEPIQNQNQPQPQQGAVDATSDNSAVLPQAGNQDFSPSQPTSRRPYAFQTPYPVFVAPLQAAQQAQPVGLPEEVCIECMMRDRDMADVDVTGGGVWERDSDADFRELLRRENEEERRATTNGDPPPKRISKGGRLTEQNIKVWLTMNPKEPAARWQTLEAYLKTQASLLEAEANARAQALHESRALESRVRDTYSQLRRSAYDTGTSAVQDDITGGVRINTPRPTSGSWGEAADRHKREMTLLENGMILERVDVRKEEKEERERRKKEERKWRKSSVGMDSNPPSPGIDYAATSSGLYDSHPATSQAALSAFSATSSPRPMSTAATSTNVRPQVPSVGSADAAANRSSRFMGFRQWSGAFGSSPSIAPSGSMIDMHLGLSQDRGMEVRSAAGTHGPSRMRRRPRTADAQMQMTNVPRSMSPDTKAPKKKKTSGIGKLWKKVTGSSSKSNGDAKHASGTDDERPLTPPPPISYLVNRGPERISPHSRHASTPTLVMSPSPMQQLPTHPRTPSVPQPSVSPATAQSSLLPSPTSNRFPWRDSGSDGRNSGGNDVEIAGSPSPMEDSTHLNDDSRRSRSLQVPGAPPTSVFKTLPPLPPGEGGRPTGADNYVLPPGAGVPAGFEGPNPSFRTDGVRRQSFGGMTSRPTTQVLADGSQQQYRTANGVNRHPQHSATDPNGRYPGETRHSEFGMSRRSLGRLDMSTGANDGMPMPSSDPAAKRRSKFGFGSLFSKKDKDRNRESRAGSPMANPGVGTSYARTSFYPQSQSMYLGPGPDTYDLSISPTLLSETLPPGPATMRSSEHRPLSSLSHAPPPPGAGSAWPPPGIHSTKRIDDLVDRDPDFVAYRYPSSDVTLDIRR